MQVAQRANVPPFHVMDLLAAAQRRQLSHGDLVNFVAGQPSTGAPKAVREEAKRLLDEETARLHGRDRHTRTARSGRRPPSSYVRHRRDASTTSSSRPGPPAGSCSPSSRPSSPVTAW